MAQDSGRPLRILHLASHELNVGDGALNAVIRDRLQALSQRRLEFTLADVVIGPPHLAAADVDAFDLVLVGGGGAINNSRRAARTGTELPMSLQEYRRSRARFAFVALGHNLFDGERCRHGDALARLIQAAAERGDPFSVRNDGSLTRVARDVGAVSSTVIEVPDPGFFIGSPAVRPHEVGNRPYAVLQVAGDSPWLRFGGGQARRVLHRVLPLGLIRTANALAEWGVRCWREHDLDILVTPHIRTDVSLAAIVLNRLYAKAGVAATHRPFRLGGTPHPSRARGFFCSYAAADLVVGMRGHAVICGVGLRRPTVALSTHPKIAGFMEACGLSGWSVSLSADFVDVITTKVAQLRNGGIAAYLDNRDRAVAGFADRLDAFLTLVLDRTGP